MSFNKLYPTDRNYSWGVHRARARIAYTKFKKLYGEDALPTRAALGRMLFHGGDGYEKAVPARQSTTIESIAWHRESGAQPGFMNRTYRRKFAVQTNKTYE